MNLVAIEAPAAGVAFARESLQLLDTRVGIVISCQLLQVFANQLIQAFPDRRRPLPRPPYQFFVHRQGDIHDHSIRAHVSRVNHLTITCKMQATLLSSPRDWDAQTPLRLPGEYLP